MVLHFYNNIELHNFIQYTKQEGIHSMVGVSLKMEVILLMVNFYIFKHKCKENKKVLHNIYYFVHL